MIAAIRYGEGKREHYAVAEVTASGWVLPKGVRSKTEQGAREKAEGAGLQVETTGDIWECVRDAREKEEETR